jgi:ADP-ribose pyrophosphatase YjhB (NUDIX family)
VIGYSPRVSKDSHCGNCGAPYGADAGRPRTCPACGTTAYSNPLPVAVALQPVRDPAHGTGLVVITRSIEPARGGTALPGGFIDHGEDWRHAVVRELREETGLEVPEHEVRLADVLSSPAHLLVFGLLPERPAAALPPFVPTAETGGRRLLHTVETLAFPLHTVAVRNWFTGAYDR